MVACISSSGLLLVLALPSLRLLYSFCPEQNGPFPVHLCWWSEEELAVLKSDGVLTFCPVSDELPNVLEASVPEKVFDTCSTLVSPGSGLFYVLEEVKTSEEKKEERSKAWTITRMAGVALYGWIKVAVSWSVGRPLSEVDVDSPESVTTTNVEFRLHEFRKTTPEEMFRKKLKSEEYSEALQLAEFYSIDTDVVYQEQWRKRPITKHSVQEYLAKVKNREWALQECLNKVANSPECCQELIGYGLKLADVSQLDRDRLREQERALCRKRVNLLHFRDVLVDYQEMLTRESESEKFESSFFARIRCYSLLDIGVYLAQTCRFAWLDVFLSRHRDILYEHWLPILSSIPEVVDVSEYQFLLPRLVNGRPKMWKSHASQISAETDLVFSEDFGVQDVVDGLKTDSALYAVEPDLLDYRVTTDPPSPDLLRRWYEKRCWDIERRTGVPEILENFVCKAVELGFGDLERLKADVRVFCKLMYDCGDCRKTLAQFQQADVFIIVKNLMDEADSETTVKYMEERVIPYILHSEDCGRCQAKEVFVRFVVEESRSSLRLASSLLESWKIRKKSDVLHRLKMTKEDLVDLVDHCLKICERTGQQLLLPAAKLLSCLEDQEMLKYGTDKTLDRLERIHLYLRALEILSFNGVDISLGELEQMVGDAQKSEALVTRLIRVACRHSLATQAGLKTVVEWERLYGDLITIQESILPKVSKARCQEIFVNGLLASGDTEKMGYVVFFAQTSADGSEKEVDGMSQKLTYDQTVSVVLAAAREYIQGAENSLDINAELAKCCLTLLSDPKPSEVSEELDFLTVLPLLEEMGVEELPVKIRIEPDKSVFVGKALRANRRHYKEARKLLKIAHLLRISSSEWARKGMTLTLCAKAALAQEDFQVATKYCKELSKMEYAKGWEECADLVLSGKVKDRDTVMELLTFTCLYCSPDRLEALLDANRQEKLLAMKEQLACDSLSEMVHKLPSPSSGWQLAVDSFITTPMEYTSGQEETKEDLLLQVATVFRILCLEAEIELMGSDKSLFERALASLTSVALSESVTWGVGCMLQLGTHWAEAEGAMNPYPKNEFALAVLLYFYALKIAAENGQWDKARLVNPSRLIGFVWKNFVKFRETESTERFERWVMVLHQFRQAGILTKLSSDIDVERFVKEDSYRRDTILGAAMTTDEEMYQNSLKLAEEYGILSWDVQMANLEFLLTDPNVHSVTVQSIVKQHKLVSGLSKEPERLFLELQDNVFPILNGKDHNRLLFYFLIMEKGCEGLPQAGVAQSHRSVLRHIMKLMPDVDYKELVRENGDLTEILWPYLKGSNFQTMGKVLQKIPTKEIRPDCVAGIYASKLFLESFEETGAKCAWRTCESVIGNLSGSGFETFATNILWRFDTLKSVGSEWKMTARMCSVYVDSNSERLCSCLDLVKEWETEVSDQIESIPLEAAVKKLTKEEQAAGGVLDCLREADFAGAGRAAAKHFGLHPSLTSHSNAVELVKKLKEKHQ